MGAPESDAVELTDVVIDDYVHHRWSDISARFDDVMRARLTDAELADGWAYIVSLAGPYESHGDTTVVRRGHFTVTDTPLVFETGHFVARVTFRDDRTIAGLFILDPEAAGDGPPG
ncbi:hypothetical protein MMAD_05970 [Mycolicibacterium madagascariense]|uniref:DUF3887 domain-containing protein n=1 Tax=Mycolicibacterium madagascariense TaxID=212765 RepID=A0A7I7XA43_9MYCO|nr:DUF3887 domain-containing protein [Mycolicibacterium madagascariense]MCV7011845.1 DUF3887 domain-containing protein [Mycolicibacterium madagascariense]BBZ26302.1 hypothetical protein MMAD_05970 [Mycolicibacterium madagascariense]